MECHTFCSDVPARPGTAFWRPGTSQDVPGRPKGMGPTPVSWDVPISCVPGPLVGRPTRDVPGRPRGGVPGRAGTSRDTPWAGPGTSREPKRGSSDVRRCMHARVLRAYGRVVCIDYSIVLVTPLLRC